MKLFACVGVFPVFEGHNQHPEVFAMLFAQVFVVHFVCPANSTHIAIIPMRPNFETLMNNNIVNQEITQAIQRNANADV